MEIKSNENLCMGQPRIFGYRVEVWQIITWFNEKVLKNI